MSNAEELIKRAREAQNRNLPVWARNLIYDLSHALDVQTRYADAVKTRAASEVDQLRGQLAEGPADADTFVAMPQSFTADQTYEVTQRPLGRGVVVEFRGPTDDEEEGFQVKIEEGRLQVESMSRLSVSPTYGGNIEIEAR